MRPRLSALQFGKKLLASRERTRAQLEASLARKDYPADEIAAALTRLEALGFLDDRRAAQAFARSAFSSRQSVAAVTRKLQAVGVEGEEAARAVESAADEVGHADEAAARALVKQRKLEGVKAARFLAGRGFDEELIRRVVPDLDAE
ncbi:MAG: regulatory protein RecX [Myxococcus sp.]|nr:regulatory protein RecX [Myxococcus sp.]